MRTHRKWGIRWHIHVSYTTNVERMTLRYMTIWLPWTTARTSLGGIGMAAIEGDTVEEWYMTGHERTSLYRLGHLPLNPSITLLRMMASKNWYVEAPWESMDVLVLLPSYDSEGLPIVMGCIAHLPEEKDRYSIWSCINDGLSSLGRGQASMSAIILRGTQNQTPEICFMTFVTGCIILCSCTSNENKVKL